MQLLKDEADEPHDEDEGKSRGSKTERRMIVSSRTVSCQERSTDATFALGTLMEKNREGQKDLHRVSVDPEEDDDEEPRQEVVPYEAGSASDWGRRCMRA